MERLKKRAVVLVSGVLVSVVLVSAPRGCSVVSVVLVLVLVQNYFLALAQKPKPAL